MRTATAAANTAVVITLPAGGASQVRALSAIHASYTGQPTAGGLTLVSTGQATYTIDIASAGAAAIDFGGAYRGMPGQTLVVTLAAGGGTVVGKLNVLADWLE
jgi:hypothetical protein